MINFVVKSDNKVEMYLKQTSLFFQHRRHMPILEEAGRKGVEALREATPKDTGLTANSWDYDITIDNAGITINWTNSNVQDGWFNVALSLQYGHGTGTGGFVEGVDYINPALQPVFDELAEKLWREVNS